MLTLALASFAFALPTAVQAPQFELQLVRADAGPLADAQVRWFEGEAPRDDLGAFEAAAVASGKRALPSTARRPTYARNEQRRAALEKCGAASRETKRLRDYSAALPLYSSSVFS